MNTSDSQPEIVAATPENIARAAQILRDGGLVAFPTETVYGLGAHALDAAAVARIYAAKGRPSYNPLIVHVVSVEGARRVVSNWPNAAQHLAQTFWPGPLTLVLPKNPEVPDEVSAGLATVGVRVPAHAVAQALLEAATIPIAAPSANRFMQLSPTRAVHVARGLSGFDLILDGGATGCGIESSVLDLSQAKPILLRPGAISRPQIEAVIGPIVLAAEASGTESRPAPGMLDRHYSPQTRALRFERRDQAQAFMASHSKRIGALVLETSLQSTLKHEIVLPRDAATYAQNLYEALHQLDAADCDFLLIEMPPNDEAWHGVRDRIRRATQQL